MQSVIKISNNNNWKDLTKTNQLHDAKQLRNWNHLNSSQCRKSQHCSAETAGGWINEMTSMHVKNVKDFFV